MKKYFCFFLKLTLAVVMVFSLSGCDILKQLNLNNADAAGSDSPTTTPAATKAASATPTTTVPSVDGSSKTTGNSIGDYYPFKANIKYIYEGKGNEFAGFNVYVDYLADSREQIRINNNGTETVKVLENKDGELRLIVKRTECFYRENLTSKKNSSPEIILKEPLLKGTSWKLADGSSRSITNTDVSISTSAGSYKCIEVSTTGTGDTVKEYYAPKVGLVKTITTSSDKSEVSAALSKMETNSPYQQTLKFYYPNVSDNTYCFIKRKLSFNTNDITKEVIEKYLRQAPNKNCGRLISDNTQVNYLYLNDDGMVYIDFSKEFVSEMNAGTSAETMILQSVADTIGDCYAAKKVIITVAGQPYSSGHIIKKKGEYFAVHPSGEAKLVEIQ